jgi:hypothetical protein
MSDDFKWYEEESKEVIIVEEVSAIAIYDGQHGHIVIRQQQHMEDDAVIIFPRLYLEAIIKALVELRDH